MTRGQQAAVASLPEVAKCAIYTRVSTMEQTTLKYGSLEAQEEICQNYIAIRAADPAMERMWVHAETYSDPGLSGGTLDRPELQRLLADVVAGKIHVIICYKVDRISRSIGQFYQVWNLLEQHGVDFASATQSLDTATSQGKLMMNLLLSFGQFEREQIGERTRDKIAASKRRGQWTGGRVVLGYNAVDKKLVVDDLEAVVVREIFSLYIQHRSALTVAQLLNESGRRTKRYRTARGHTQKGRTWDKPAVLRVLKNPIFAGYIPLGDELHEGEHEAIVDRDTFHRVQALLDEHKKSGNRRGRNPDYLLTGLLRCGSCGSAMTTASTTTRGKLYRYYRCCRQGKEGGESCPSKQLPASAIEDFVVERIREAASDPSLVADVSAKLQQRVQHRRQELHVERKALPTAIAALSVEANALVDTLAGSTGTARRMLEERVEALGQQLSQHESRLAEVQRALAALKQTEIEGRWVAETLGRFDTVWDSLTPENRLRLVRALVRRVVVDEAENEVSVEMVDLGAEEDGR